MAKTGKSSKQSASKHKKARKTKDPSTPMRKITDDTGIYQHVVEEELTAEDLRQKTEVFDLGKLLPRVERNCREILTACGYDKWPHITRIMRPDPRHPGREMLWKESRTVPEVNTIAKDADDALYEIAFIRRNLAAKRYELAIAHGFQLGIRVERMGVRAFEPFVKSGRASQLGRIKSQESRSAKSREIDKQILGVFEFLNEQYHDRTRTYVIEKVCAQMRERQVRCGPRRVQRIISEAGLTRSR